MTDFMITFVYSRARMALWTLFYKIFGRLIFQKMGSGISCEGWIDIPQRGGRICIGNNVHICRHVEFSVPQGGNLIIGNNVFIGRGVMLSAHSQISIGEDTLIAEYVSIHDNNHCTGDSHLPISNQGFQTEAIEIGRNCWLGAHAILLKGSGIGAGCVVGAGAVVTKKFPDHAKLVGTPARPINKKL